MIINTILKLRASKSFLYLKQYFMLLLNGALCGIVLMMAFYHNYDGHFVSYWMKGTAIAAVTFSLGHWDIEFNDIKQLGLKRLAVNIMGISATLTPFLIFQFI